MQVFYILLTNANNILTILSLTKNQPTMTKLARNLKVFLCFGLSVFIPYYAYFPYNKWKKKLKEVDDELYIAHIDKDQWITRDTYSKISDDMKKLLVRSETMQRRIEMLEQIKDMWLPWVKWYIIYYYLLGSDYMKERKLVIHMNDVPRKVMHAV